MRRHRVWGGDLAGLETFDTGLGLWSTTGTNKSQSRASCLPGMKKVVRMKGENVCVRLQIMGVA